MLRYTTWPNYVSCHLSVTVSCVRWVRSVLAPDAFYSYCPRKAPDDSFAEIHLMIGIIIEWRACSMCADVSSGDRPV